MTYVLCQDKALLMQNITTFCGLRERGSLTAACLSWSGQAPDCMHIKVLSHPLILPVDSTITCLALEHLDVHFNEGC